MKHILILASLLGSLSASALTKEFKLPTSKGDVVYGNLYIPDGAKDVSAVVIAPGMSCNSKGPLMQAFGDALVADGTRAIARFEWSYCNDKPQDPQPSDDQLSHEYAEFMTVVEYVRAQSGVDPKKVSFAGKSMGTIVAYAGFVKNSSAKSLILLTPVCSDIADDGTDVNVINEVYPDLKKDTRPILFELGDADLVCKVSHLQEYLKDAPANISMNVFLGDHSFNVRDAQGNVDAEKTKQNIESLINATIKWLKNI